MLAVELMAKWDEYAILKPLKIKGVRKKPKKQTA